MKSVIFAGLLLASSSVAALAGQPYAEIGLGATFGQSLSTKTYTLNSGANTATGRADLDYDMGLAAGAEVGYAGVILPEVRVGLDYDFLESNFHSGKVIGTVNGAAGSFAFDRATVLSLGGNLDYDSHLVTANAYYDLPSVGVLQPYVGAGLGGAFINNAGDSFAVTATAGFRVPLNNSLYLGARYRFYHINSTRDNSGVAFDSYGTHSIMAMLGVNLD